MEVIVPRTSDIGGFTVHRALPSAQRRTVGPFVFLDQMGPEVLAAGRGIDVRPHPHIGLATVTYLFEGALLHRDSLGVVQHIEPGALNWMTAGRGIVHSERSPDDQRTGASPLSGIQTWVGLPREHEEAEPAFVHHAAGELPPLEARGVRGRLIIGELGGQRSPVATLSPTLYADLTLEPGATFEIDAAYEERAAYLVDGALEVLPGRERFEPGRLLVFRPGAPLTLRAQAAAARLLLLGGAPLDGHRFVWWNFVSSSRERIEQAKQDWRDGRFGAVPGETDFIPLPGDEPKPVDYP